MLNPLENQSLECYTGDPTSVGGLMANERTVAAIDVNDRILTMSTEEVSKVRQFEGELLHFPQTAVPTHHVLHGGMYSRTIMVPAGVMLTGSLMKIATLLIISGDFVLFAGDAAIEIVGYRVFTGGANRKQVGVARKDTWVTMIFPTDAKDIDAAEKEFTDEYDLLASRADGAVNHINITGE